MGSKFEALVRYEDERPDERVTIGQREMAAFEAQPMARYGGGNFLRIRYAAYDALRRAGRLPRGRKGQPVDWDAWDDLVDEVVDADDDDEESEADPTQPGQPAES